MIKRILQISNLLLITLAVYVSVKVFYGFVEIKLHHFGLIDRPAKPVAAAEFKRNRQLFPSYDVVVERNLFNTAKTTRGKKPEPKIDLTALKQTELNLKLRGTATTEDRRSGMARAVIEARASKQQQLYKVGDTIEHARIAAILRNSVVLEINGRKEKLTLEEIIPGLANRVVTGLDHLPSPVQTAKVESEPGPRIEPGRKISIQRSQIDNAFKNIGQLMNEVKVRPYFQDQDGEPAGFIMADIAPKSIVREIGMKDGDIITSINGRQIQTADDALAFYENLKVGDKLSVGLIRRGRPQIFEFTVNNGMLGGISP